MRHPNQETLLAAARNGCDQSDVRTHLAECGRCRAEVAAWRAVAQAVRHADAQVGAQLRVPPFVETLAPALTDPDRAFWV
jgi:hypothetical protein